MTVPEIAPIDAADAIAQGAFLLDVREADEWAAGHAAAATWIALGGIADRVAEIPADRQVVCICRSGARSTKATEFLAARGITAVNLVGGMQAWAAAGLDVTTDDGLPGTVI